MKILAFESTAKAASVALCEDSFLIAQSFQNSGLTHSTTLLPMAEDLLKNCGIALHDIDALAVAIGPGSFTGLRIGISTVKGLSWGKRIPCFGVSTLEAMAYTVSHMNGIICCAMDARRAQVYNALFSANNGALERLTEDRAISLAELSEQLKCYPQNQIIVGDGAVLCYNYLQQMGLKATLAPPNLLHQSAYGVAAAAFARAQREAPVSGDQLIANYLRPSQAERERNEKLQQQGKGNTI